MSLKVDPNGKQQNLILGNPFRSARIKGVIWAFGPTERKQGGCGGEVEREKEKDEKWQRRPRLQIRHARMNRSERASVGVGDDDETTTITTRAPLSGILRRRTEMPAGMASLR